MNEEELKQIIAELIHSQAEAIGLVVTAISRQLDINQLSDDLRSHIPAAQMAHLVSPLAIRIASGALAAADAELALRNVERH